MDDLAQTEADAAVPAAPVAPQSSKFAQIFAPRLVARREARFQDDQQNAYRQQLALQHLQQQERDRRKDAIDLAKELKPAYDQLAKSRLAFAAVSRFKGTDQYQLASEQYAAAQAYVNALQQAGGESWKTADAAGHAILPAIAGLKMPQGQGQDTFERPSYASPKEPQAMGPVEPPPPSQEDINAPVEHVQPPPGQEMSQGITLDQWKQGLSDIGFDPKLARPDGESLVYTVDSDKQAAHLQGILDEMGKEWGRALPVRVDSREGPLKLANSDQQFLLREARLSGDKSANFRRMNLPTAEDTDIEAFYRDAVSRQDDEMAASLNSILNTKKELRGPLIREIQSDFDARAASARTALDANAGPYAAYKEWLAKQTGAAPARTTLGGLTPEMTDALNSYLAQEATNRGFNPAKLTPEQIQVLKPLRDAWLNQHGAAGR